MRVKKFSSKVIFILCLTNTCLAEDVSSQARENLEAKKLNYGHAMLLGFVEGITEYLPISSTGHLILVNACLSLDGDTPIKNQDGDLILVKDSNSSALRPYTIGEASYAYIIIIQAGAIAAVIMLYWRRILQIIKGCVGKDLQGRKLAFNLICAFIPAALVGLLLNDSIEKLLGNNISAIAGALIAGAILMLLVERWRKQKRKIAVITEEELNLYDLTIRQSTIIGLFQCIAMWPGTSRSMMTILGGYIAGLSPKNAAEFSFLLGLITLSAASAFKILTDGKNMVAALELGPIFVGFLSAFFSAAISIRWFVNYLNKNGLSLFAWYRLILAVVVLFMLR